MSPDRSAVAFVCDRTELPRLEVAQLDSAVARQVSLPDEEVISVSWSPDGQWLVYLVSPHGSIRAELHAVRPDGTGHRVLAGTGTHETAFLGAWSAVPGRYVFSLADGLGPDADVAVVEVETGRVQRLSAGTGHGFHTVCAVSSDGRWVLARRGPRNQRTLYLLPGWNEAGFLDGQPMRLLENDFPLELDDTAEDGRFFDADRIYVRTRAGTDRIGLVSVPVSVDGPRSLTPLAFRPDADLESFGVLDSGEPLLVWNVDGQSCLEIHGTDGRVRDIELPGTVLGGWGLTDGALVAEIAGPRRPRPLLRVPLDETTATVLPAAPEEVSPDLLVDPDSVLYPSLDGTTLQGWLYRPLSAAEPGPTVISFHGGPESQERAAFSILTQALLAAGITVFAPNVRGSSGFGARFTAADDGSARPDSFQDVRATADFLVAAGIAAPGRIAVNGWSYGGYLAFTAVTRWPELFAAGATHAGMSDLLAFFAETEPWMAAASVTEYGDPATQPELLRALSPLTSLAAVRTPLLLIHGDRDTNVPVGESVRAHAALQAAGIPTELLLLPGEGHTIVGAPAREQLALAVVGWFRRWLRVDEPVAAVAAVAAVEAVEPGGSIDPVGSVGSVGSVAPDGLDYSAWDA